METSINNEISSSPTTVLAKEYHPSNPNSVVLVNQNLSKTPVQSEHSSVRELCLPEKSKSRTRVFAGRSMVSSSADNGVFVPSLVQLCLTFLSDNLIYIRDFGPMVPFHLVEPVLERATPEQLRRLESWNPHLLPDTVPLWRQHLLRDFRTQV